MKQYSFIKQSMPGLVARGASILATRVKMSRRPSGAVSSVLQRLGLQAAPPRTNVGRGIARGLGYGALAAPVAAYGGARAAGYSDEEIGTAIGDAAVGLTGGIGLADARSMSMGAQRSAALNKNVDALLARPENAEAERLLMMQDGLAKAREEKEKLDPHGKAYYTRIGKNSPKAGYATFKDKDARDYYRRRATREGVIVTPNNVFYDLFGGTPPRSYPADYTNFHKDYENRKADRRDVKPIPPMP